MSRFKSIRKKAALVRDIELCQVLKQMGSVSDKKDPAKWHTGQGLLSVNGQKFFNWTKNRGGGGAIDLIIHLHQVDFIQAVAWLDEHFASPERHTLNEEKTLTHTPLVLPKSHPEGLPQIIRYLTSNRCLPQALILSLIDTGDLYADDQANAVFLLRGKGKIVVGAEIRGTTNKIWHALAPGSKKNSGFFYIKSDTSKQVVICESAIDALSYYSLNPDCIAISTAGAHPNPPWLSSLIKRGYKVFCGFDADKTGDLMAKQMTNLYPVIERLRPEKHDWNDVLKLR
jgi:hypothetical protein